jgi:hydrogenase/urease accessory protein HupE
MVDKTRADQISGGIFLIGLALLFLTGFWWPGIMFVIGASAMARGMAEGQQWYTVTGGLWMIGLGIVFWAGFSLPLLLILLGVSSLLGYGFKQQSDQKPKAKTDSFYEDDSEVSYYEDDPKRKNEDLM